MPSRPVKGKPNDVEDVGMIFVREGDRLLLIIIDISEDGEFEKLEECVVDVTKWTDGLRNIQWDKNESLLEPRENDGNEKKIEKGVQTDFCRQLKTNYLKPSSSLSGKNSSTWNLTLDGSNLKDKEERGKITSGRENKKKQRERDDFHKYAHGILHSIIEQKLEFVTTVKQTHNKSKDNHKEGEDMKLFSRSLPFENPKCSGGMETTESIPLNESSSSDSDIDSLEAIVVTSDDVRKQVEIIGKRKMKKNEVLLKGIFRSNELSNLR
jgi:hypothetical protein